MLFSQWKYFWILEMCMCYISVHWNYCRQTVSIYFQVYSAKSAKFDYECCTSNYTLRSLQCKKCISNSFWELAFMYFQTVWYCTHTYVQGRFKQNAQIVHICVRLQWSRGSVLAFGTRVCRFTPGRSRRIFRAKKSSARLPSEGK